MPLEHSTKPVSEITKDDIIALSSDDDACGEDDNYEINIKVFWRSRRLDRLSMCRVCIPISQLAVSGARKHTFELFPQKNRSRMLDI